jgi:hypothetical protein
MVSHLLNRCNWSVRRGASRIRGYQQALTEKKEDGATEEPSLLRAEAAELLGIRESSSSGQRGP